MKVIGAASSRAAEGGEAALAVQFQQMGLQARDEGQA